MSRANGKHRHDGRPAILDEIRQLNDEYAEETYPTVHSLLAPGFKDGKCTRLGAVIRLRVVGCRYMVTVSCETEEVQATVLLASLENALETLERSLASPETTWLPDFQATKRARQESRR